MTDVPQGKKTVDESEIVEFLAESPDPAFTTPEIADEFGVTTEGIRRHLNKLAKEGRLERKKPTKRTIIWWHPDDYRERLSSA